MEVKKHPFKLLNGTTVLVRPYTLNEYNEVNRWVKKKYMENVREACYGLDEQSKLDLRLAALSNAAKLTFQVGEGREIIMDDIQGFAFLGYKLIDNPGFSFDEYFKILYPDGVLTEEGLLNLMDMMSVAYEDEEIGEPIAEEEKSEPAEPEQTAEVGKGTGVADREALADRDQE